MNMSVHSSVTTPLTIWLENQKTLKVLFLQTFIAVLTLPSEVVSVVQRKTNATYNLANVWDSVGKIQKIQLNVTIEYLFMFQNAHCVFASRHKYIFWRGIADIWLISYNEHLLKTLDENIDIQPVFDPYSCIMYVRRYKKAERDFANFWR